MKNGPARTMILFVTLAGLAAGCTQSPKPYSNQMRRGGNQSANAEEQNEIAARGGIVSSGLVFSNKKLSPLGTALTAKIEIEGQSVSQNFTPTGESSVVSLSGFKPTSADALLNIQIFAGSELKFVAKLSKIRLQKPASDRVIVDDCAILPVPWDGRANEGSCQWAISEE